MLYALAELHLQNYTPALLLRNYNSRLRSASSDHSNNHLAKHCDLHVGHNLVYSGCGMFSSVVACHRMVPYCDPSDSSKYGVY